MQTLTPPVQTLLYFVIMWTIGQACEISHTENLYFSSFVTICQAYLNGTYTYIWEKLHSSPCKASQGAPDGR